MTMRIKDTLAVCAILLALAHPASADNFASGLQTGFDWQTAWGTIDFTGKGADTGIPSEQLQPKSDIKDIISSEGTQSTDLSSLAAYTLDLNGDGKPDYILDGKGYFPQYQNPNADTKICTTADGCYLSIYIRGEDTNLLTAAKAGDPVCPATPEANTSCIASCAATEQNCPANFKYNTNTAFDEQILKWNFISADDFKAWATGKSYTLYSGNPVFVVLRNNTNCYNDELASNNNQCIKYYQYFGDANNGTFLDLYSYSGNQNANGDYNPRWTYNSFSILNTASGQSYNWDGSKKNLAPPQPGDNLNYGTGYGLKLVKGGSIDMQFAQFEFTPTIPGTTFGFNGTKGYPNKPNVASFHIENHSNHDYFVPVNTNTEFRAFVDSRQTGVTVGPEKLQFTAWTGQLTCPALVTAPTTIAAQRFCQSSTTDYRPCQACIDAKVPGYEQGCTVTQKCDINACRWANICPSHSHCNETNYFPPNGAYMSLAQCESNTGYWTATYMHGAVQSSGCAGAFNELCKYGHFCVAGESMVSLPDGTTKAIKDIKAGDMVLGFSKPRQALKPYKVAKLAITPNEPMISINGQLNLTPNHKVVTGMGHLVEASKLKVGSALMLGDRKKLIVKTLEPVESTDTVYNLEFDTPGIGFVADGVRVGGYK